MSDSPPPSAPESALPSWVTALAERARAVDGQPPFSDQALVDARRGERRVLAIGESAVALLASATDGPAEAEFVVDPDARRHGHGTALVETLIAESAGELLIWAHGDHPAARALAARFGFENVRTLLQLLAEVEVSTGTPLPEPVEGQVSTSTPLPEPVEGQVSTRSTSEASFRPGIDDADWLALNARAFASHPEQGSVSQSDLTDLTREPWFDADDFLLLRDENIALIGYCWLKVEDGIGEFYVVGVDPDRQGAGLGRRLVAAGLARLASRGIRTAALYVEADNEPAVRLYRSFGFTDHSVDIQYALRRFTSR